MWKGENDRGGDNGRYGTRERRAFEEFVKVGAGGIDTGVINKQGVDLNVSVDYGQKLEEWVMAIVREGEQLERFELSVCSPLVWETGVVVDT